MMSQPIALHIVHILDMANMPLHHINIQSMTILTFITLQGKMHSSKFCGIKTNCHLQWRELLPIEVLIEVICGFLCFKIYENTVLIIHPMAPQQHIKIGLLGHGHKLANLEAKWHHFDPLVPKEGRNSMKGNKQNIVVIREAPDNAHGQRLVGEFAAESPEIGVGHVVGNG